MPRVAELLSEEELSVTLLVMPMTPVASLFLMKIMKSVNLKELV